MAGKTNVSSRSNKQVLVDEVPTLLKMNKPFPALTLETMMDWFVIDFKPTLVNVYNRTVLTNLYMASPLYKKIYVDYTSRTLLSVFFRLSYLSSFINCLFMTLISSESGLLLVFYRLYRICDLLWYTRAHVERISRSYLLRLHVHTRKRDINE